MDEARGVEVGGGRERPGAALGPAGHRELPRTQGVGQQQQVLGPALEGAARLRVRSADARPIDAHEAQAVGLRRGIEERRLEAARGTAVVVQDECAVRIARFEIGQGALTDLNFSLVRHVCS